MTKSHTHATLQTIVNTLDEFLGFAGKPEYLRVCKETGVGSPKDFMAGVESVERFIRQNYLAKPRSAKAPCVVLAFDRRRHPMKND